MGAVRVSLARFPSEKQSAGLLSTKYPEILKASIFVGGILITFFIFHFA